MNSKINVAFLGNKIVLLFFFFSKTYVGKSKCEADIVNRPNHELGESLHDT